MSALIDGKIIVSHHLPAMPNDGLLPSTVKTIISMAMRTRYDGKTIITGMGIGRIENGQIETTETTNRVIQAMAKSPEFKGRLLVVECRNSSTANKRILTALKAAQNGDGLLIVCKDSTVYDDIDIYHLLGVEKELT